MNRNSGRGGFRCAGAGVFPLIVALAVVGDADVTRAGPRWDEIAATGKVVLPMDPDYRPQSFQDADGHFQGFDPDVARALGSKMGVEVEFLAATWKEIVTPSKWAANWSFAVGSMSTSESRSNNFELVGPYYFSAASFFVANDSDIQDISELAGRTVGVCDGCIYEDFLLGTYKTDGRAISPPVFPAPEIVHYSTDVDIMRDLSNSQKPRVEAGFSSILTIKSARKAGLGIRVVGPPVFIEPLFVTVPREEPVLKDRVQKALDELRKSGELAELSKKNFETDLTIFIEEKAK